jgi:hypothetical protein
LKPASASNVEIARHIGIVTEHAALEELAIRDERHLAYFRSNKRLALTDVGAADICPELWVALLGRLDGCASLRICR